MRFNASFLSAVRFLIIFIISLVVFVLPQTADLSENRETSAPKINQSINQSINQLALILNSSTRATMLPSAPVVPAGTTAFDFDGDGLADLSRFQASTGAWRIRRSSDEAIVNVTFGDGTGAIVPADYDGDATTDPATFKTSTGAWTIKKSSDGATQSFTFGQSGDKPVVADYDGDGLADAAVFRASNSTWYVRKSSNNSTVTQAFGSAGDIPVVGNFDGNGDDKADFAVFRPSTGHWYVLQSSNGSMTSVKWGVSGDIPVAADYDGDGKTDYAVFRPSAGIWYVWHSSNGGMTYTEQAWGNYGDQPVPADYDNDRKADFAVWRPSSGVWHLVKSATNLYEYKTLGVNGDMPTPAAYLPKIGASATASALAKARLLPKNETGGTNLYSQNFGWGTGLVGLAGRGGLDAGLSLSYNSLIWTREGNRIYFDTNADNVSPGFRFGFPVIEPAYYNKTTGKWNYLLVSPSGGRTEFRETGASEVFEATDSSYAQIKVDAASGPNTPLEEIRLTLTNTGGTQVLLKWKAGAFRVTEIKDRNGNFITVNHDAEGLLRTVTDTLGRIITVNYDGLYPTSITQTWKNNNGAGSSGGGGNVTYTWATFVYTTKTVNPNFAGSLTVFGPTDATIKVLEKVISADTSYTKFEYNQYGQVFKVSNYAIDQHLLNYVRTDLQSPSATQTNNNTDCPRFTKTYSWVENYNGLPGVPAITEVTNSLQTGVIYAPAGSAPTTLIETFLTGDPHLAISKTYVGESGWREGLPIVTEDWATGANGLERKRWTWTEWTQDFPNEDYLANPRVTESKVGDTTNIKRSTVSYYLHNGTTISIAGLVSESKVYDTDQTTVLKRSTQTYNFDNDYISRRIIGLPTLSKLYDGNDTLLAQVGYEYDIDEFDNEELQQDISPIQHDTTNYGRNLTVGRGNLTGVTRYDATGATARVDSHTKYNTAGLPVAQIDPLGRTVKIEYNDSFNDGNNSRNTFAYPTKLTDLTNPNNDNNFSTVKYRFDIGANVRAKSPAAAGNAPNSGKETTREFDGLGRLLKQKLVNTGAYTRYNYLPSQIQSEVYTTVTDADNNGQIDIADEVKSESFFDGAGRAFRSRSPMSLNAEGNTLTWVGQMVEYDIRGQVKRQSLPTEMDGSWNATGDDQTRGWQWTSQVYDWKGRVTEQIGLGGENTLISYEGCGCAGNQVTTVKGELLDNGKRRTQKMYADILGRTVKTEVIDWDDDVYLRTENTFNGRDQVTQNVQTDYSQPTTPVTQTTSMTYDGHGRLKTHRLPAQNEVVASTYNYFADDRIQAVTDGRGASSTFIYNNRGLLERVNYSLPNAGSNFPTINPNSNGASSTCSPNDPDFPDCGGGTPPTPTPYLSSVEFQYDALGNRTQMIDTETGTTNYQYNQLSQMTGETKIMRSDWQIPNHTFNITYGYDLTGRLASVTDPFGERIDYKADKLGRLEQITGTAFGGVTNYVNDIDYRAWGAVKQMTYGNNVEMKQTFDNRLRVSEFKLALGTANPYIKKNYEYYNDNRLKFSDDSSTSNPLKVPEHFDRSYSYDFVGRLTSAKTGIEARGGTATDRNEVPYKHDYAYNAFGNVTSRQTFTWTQADNQTHLWTNNRESTWTYDADGRLKATPENRYYYDASGQVVMTTLNNNQRIIRHLDGEGRAIRRNEYVYHSYQYHLLKTDYTIYSSVLGKELTEVKSDGTKKKTNVYGIGGVVATQNKETSPAQVVRWEHLDPARESYTETELNGIAYNLEKPAELDPLGSNVGLASPFGNNPENAAGPGMRWGDPFGSFTCMIDGDIRPCSQVMFALSIGAAQFSLNHEIPFGIPGRWVDENNPNLPPPTEANGWNTGVISRFVPMLFGSFGVQIQNSGNEPLTTTTIRPSSTFEPKKLSEKDCNFLINYAFGTPESRVSTITDVETLKKYPGQNYGKHLALNGAIHIYGNSDGTSYTGPLYIPSIGNLTPTYLKGYTAPESGDSGTFTNTHKWKYNNGLVIEVFHLGGTTDDEKLGTSVMGKYGGAVNSAGSLQIGTVAGLGSSTFGYYHSHINFKVNGIRVDPRHFFCAGYPATLPPRVAGDGRG